MTQYSRPQAGLFPGDGDDCGAYTANEWAAVLIAQNRSGGMMITGAAAPPGLPATQLFPNVGVYYAVADRLVVTSPGASQISIATGAGIVDGRVFINDTSVTAAAITNPAANPRIDRVVLRQNYTGADYTSVNAPPLVVDLNTTRIAIISGAEAVGPVAPTLTQDEDRATYWDIPIYQYEISVAGAITGLTDEREWVDAETKYSFAPYTAGYDLTGAGALDQKDPEGIEMPASILAECYAKWHVPHDYIGEMACSAVMVPNDSGDIVFTHIARYGECDANEWDANTDRSCFQDIIALDAQDIKCLCPLDLQASLSGRVCAIGDVVFFNATRTGTDVNDTVGTVYFVGERITYFGWGRR